MAKIPVRPEDIFDEFTHDYQDVFGPDLLSIVLYGSGARGEYIPRKSDINFLIVLTEKGINTLGNALAHISKWHKRRVSTPLFLTKDYIASSTDTFPIEFLNLKSAYHVVYGEDVLQGIQYEKKFLRLQCEREIKGKLLQLRENFLETGGNRREIQTLISLSLPTFFSIFRAVLALQDTKPPADKQELVTRVADITGMTPGLFLQLIAVRQSGTKIASKDAVPIMEQYIGEIRKLAVFVDRMAIP